MSTPPATQLPSNNRGTVLVLEDSLHSRNIVKFFLEKNNFAVQGFSNGEEAMKFINASEVSTVKLILSDIMMPEMDGLEFIRKLKESNKLPGVPIVIMSAVAEKESILEAKALGVFGYMLKPISVLRVTEVLKKVFPNETFKDISSQFNK